MFPVYSIRTLDKWAVNKHLTNDAQDKNDGFPSAAIVNFGFGKLEIAIFYDRKRYSLLFKNKHIFTAQNEIFLDGKKIPKKSEVYDWTYGESVYDLPIGNRMFSCFSSWKHWLDTNTVHLIHVMDGRILIDKSIKLGGVSD